MHPQHRRAVPCVLASPDGTDCPLPRLRPTLDARADERLTRGFISMMTISPSCGGKHVWTNSASVRPG